MTNADGHFGINVPLNIDITAMIDDRGAFGSMLSGISIYEHCKQFMRMGYEDHLRK